MKSLNNPTLLVIGATGFVGRRFCQYLLDQKYYEKCNLVFTARNLQKLSKFFPAKEGDQRFSTRELDTLKDKQINSAIESCNFVANFAGPFDLYAEKVIQFCSSNGIHYFDITGEFHFVKKMIQKYQKQALSTGASIIPFSGFDSIPSEVSSIKSIDQYRKKYNADPSKIEHLYFAKGGFNGGTIASAFNFSDKVSLKDFLNDHFLINNSKKIKDISKTKYFPSLKLWGSPFFMESVNSKVVFFSLSNKRENDIIKALEYSEHINLNKKSGKITHKIGTGFMNSANLLMAKKFGQTILRPFLPSPGQGPSEKSINEGFFKLTTITSGKEGEIISKMNGRGDPGNKVTVNCMLSVLDSLLETPNPTAGFLTPFSCFGEQIVQNLEKHEIFYEGIK